MKRQVLLLFSFLTIGIVTYAQNWDQVIKTVANQRNNKAPGIARSGDDNFGRSVSIDGDYAVVSAYHEGEDTAGGNSQSNAGAVYIFKKTGTVWEQVKKIVASDRGASDFFGYTVSISGNIVVVGAYQEDEDASGANTLGNAGSAYIFYKDQGGVDNWGQVKKIVASDRAANDNFGNTVSINGNIVVVGAYQEDEDASGANTTSNAGSAYIFYKDQGGTDNWGQVKKIVASDRATNDFFGNTVSINGNIVVVGAYQEDEDASGANTTSNAGSAYIFYKDQGGVDNWGQVKKIVASDRAGNDFFGYSVSINGNIVVVGAYQEDEDASGANTLGNAGSAYIFYKDQGGTDNWGQVKKIVASDRATNDYFGYSVSINGNIVVVGAYQEDEDASGANTTSNAGSAYIFYKDQGGVDNWGQAKKIVANDRGANDYFGYSVAISGNSIIAGAYLEDEDVYGTTTVLSAGSAYLFNKDAGGANNWGQEQKIVMDDVPAAQKYGNSVSIDGDYAVIGAPGVAFDASGTQPLKDAGAAYILKKINGNWVQIKKIVANDRAAIDNFGYSVSISGNTVVVGAYHEDENATGASTLISAGSVYIFYKDQGGVDNWGQVKKIVANDRAASDFFGYSVSINGNIVVVGAYQEDEDASGANPLGSAGSAYIFYKDQGGMDNWGQVKKIVASDRAANDFFGNTVSINGNIVVVGAYQEDEDASGANTLSNAGSAYIFYKDQGGVDNWGQVKKIVASDRAANDYFGFSVAINGSLIVVGAPFEDHDAAGANPQTDAGSIYIFSKNQGGADKWGQIKKKVSIEREDNYNLGNSVAINGNTIVAGAYRHAVDDVANNYIFNAGAANIFRKDQGGVNNWGEADKKVASDRGYNDYFGNSVAISGNDIVVGAPYEDDDIEETNNIADAGSAYFFNSCSAHTLPSTFAAAIGAQVWFESRDIKNVDCNLIATLSELPNDGTPIYTTNVSAKVWIESTQPGNFVKRHYEITPVHTVNGYNVTVTLYFTQQEFNDFNAVNASKLPTGPSDAAGKANLRIEKKSGISSDGSGLPNTYTGAAETIDPNDAFIVWNSSLSRWEVSFQVTSFSGFFVKTQLFALPVQWLSINGYLNNQKQTILNWKVQEQNISDYTIEKSEDGRSFHSIGIVAGKGDGTNSYAYLDVNPVSGTVFYRIKQKDIESRTSYSTIIKISTDSKAKLQAFPTFAHEGFTVVSPILQTAVLYDMNGRTLKQIALQAGSNYVNISNLAAGMYLLKASHGDVIKIEKQ